MNKKIMIALIIVIYCLVLRYLFHVIFPFLLAILFYYLIKPVIDMMENYLHLKRSAIGITFLLCLYFLFILLFVVIGIYSVLFLFDFVKHIPDFYQSFCLPLIESFIVFIEKYFSFVGEDVFYSLINLFQQILGSLMSSFSSFLTSVPQFIFSFFLFALSTFFLVIDYDDMRHDLFSKSSPIYIRRIIDIKNKSLESIRIYIKCQLILMITTFLMLCLAFFALKMQKPFFYAFCTALLDSLPIIGIGIVLFPMLIFYCLKAAYLKALYIFLIYLIINVIRSFLEPKILNKHMKIPSFLLLFSMILHFHFFGVVGLILSPIHMNIIYSFLK